MPYGVAVFSICCLILVKVLAGQKWGSRSSKIQFRIIPLFSFYLLCQTSVFWSTSLECCENGFDFSLSKSHCTSWDSDLEPKQRCVKNCDYRCKWSLRLEQVLLRIKEAKFRSIYGIKGREKADFWRSCYKKENLTIASGKKQREAGG